MLALGTASVKGVNWVITVPTEIDCKQTCHTTETLRLLMPHLLDHLFCLFTTFIVIIPSPFTYGLKSSVGQLSFFTTVLHTWTRSFVLIDCTVMVVLRLAAVDIIDMSQLCIH